MSSSYLYGAHVHANGIRQHYLRYGGNDGARADRDAVVILPGITSPAVTWGFVGERFGRVFDTYIVDIRGRGLTEAAVAMDYSLDAQAADALAFVQALGLERYALIGHSMGARIAIRAARNADRTLTRAVAVDPPVSGPGRRPYPAQLPWYVDSIRQARHGITVEQMRSFCPTWTEEQLRLRAEWLHTCNEEAIVTSFHAFQTDDVHADLPHLKVPLLLMSAERGDVVRAGDVDEILGLAPEAQHTRVAAAGHMIPWDNLDDFLRAVEPFVSAP